MGVYNYTKEIRAEKLLLEIEATLSITLDGSDGRIHVDGTNDVTIVTDTDLSAEDKVILDNIVANHVSNFSEGDFDSTIYLLRLSQEFTALERKNLALVAPNFTLELKFKQFSACKTLIDDAYTNEYITEAQRDLLKSLFTEQNINIDNY